jgi:hypothetical protein
MPQFFGFFGTCEKMLLLESVPGHKIMVNKTSNTSDFVIKYLEYYDTPSVAGMVGLGIGAQPTSIQANA